MKFSINQKQVTSCCNEMTDIQNVIRRKTARIEEIAFSLKATHDEAQIILSNKLLDENENILKEVAKLGILESGLHRILQEYEHSEENISSFEAGMSPRSRVKGAKFGKVNSRMDNYIQTTEIVY